LISALKRKEKKEEKNLKEGKSNLTCLKIKGGGKKKPRLSRAEEGKKKIPGQKKNHPRGGKGNPPSFSFPPPFLVGTEPSPSPFPPLSPREYHQKRRRSPEKKGHPLPVRGLKKKTGEEETLTPRIM